MGKIVEYTMIDGTKDYWPIANIDDEALVGEELQDDFPFVKRFRTIMYARQGKLYESPATVWLNKAYITTVVIKDKEPD